MHDVEVPPYSQGHKSENLTLYEKLNNFKLHTGQLSRIFLFLGPPRLLQKLSISSQLKKRGGMTKNAYLRGGVRGKK